MNAGPFVAMREHGLRVSLAHMRNARLPPLLPPALLAWALLLPGTGSALELRAVEVRGLDDEDMRDNVDDALSLQRLNPNRRKSLSESRLAYLLRQVPRETREALEPFGHYDPSVVTELVREGEAVTVIVRVEAGEPVRVRGRDLRIDGPAEGSLLGRHGMRSIGVPQSFAFSRHTEPVKPEPVFVPMPTPPRSAAPIPVKPRPFSTASTQVVPIKAPPSDAADLLSQIATLANEGKSAEARAACEHYLRSHEPVAQVFYWLGLLSDVAGSALEAQSYYRKALYLEPQHPEALMHLAALLQAQGDTAGARRLQERAARSGRTADSERKR